MGVGYGAQELISRMDVITKKNTVRMKSTIAGILALIWMCIIFAFSAQTKEESGSVSVGLSYRMVNTTGRLLHLNIDEEKIKEIANAIDFYVRKGAHMTEYAILAILLYVWLGRWQVSRTRLTCIAGALTVLYACSDEFHQLFVEGRAGRVSDVLIDSAGAVLGLALFLFIRTYTNKAAERRKEL